MVQYFQLSEFVILDFSEIYYSEKPIFKVNIQKTGIILEMYGTIFHTFIIPN